MAEELDMTYVQHNCCKSAVHRLGQSDRRVTCFNSIIWRLKLIVPSSVLNIIGI